MLKQIIRALTGKVIWNQIVIANRLMDYSVVIFLPESDIKWNGLALDYLPVYMERKKATEAYVYVEKKIQSEILPFIPEGINVKVKSISYQAVVRILEYYCLHCFSRNIVFFFKDKPADNRTDVILSKTTVTEIELICHGFYKLRGVQKHV